MTGRYKLVADLVRVWRMESDTSNRQVMDSDIQNEQNNSNRADLSCKLPAAPAKNTWAAAVIAPTGESQSDQESGISSSTTTKNASKTLMAPENHPKCTAHPRPRMPRMAQAHFHPTLRLLGVKPLHIGPCFEPCAPPPCGAYAPRVPPNPHRHGLPSGGWNPLGSGWRCGAAMVLGHTSCGTPDS